MRDGSSADRLGPVTQSAASAIILAGGRGSRMGRPKATLQFGAESLIERIAAELRRAFDDIVVMASPEAEAIPLPVLKSATIVRDEIAYQGPVGAIARGLRAVRHEAAFICSCDLPTLRAEVASWLASLMLDPAGAHDAVIPRIGGRLQTLHAVYSRRSADAFEAMVERGKRPLGAIVDIIDARIVAEAEYRRADPDCRSCFNINRPADYKRALKIAAGVGRTV